jgi:hypothetical protein
VVEQIYCPHTQVAITFDLCNCWKTCFSCRDGENVGRVFCQGVYNSIAVLVGLTRAAI